MNDPAAESIKPIRAFAGPGLFQSLRHAFRGICSLIRSERNARIHAGATFVVLGIGFYFGLAGGEWCWMIVAMCLVWMAEALNTALEFLADVSSPAFHPLVRHAKDVAAGAVLISAVAASIIGLIILRPYLVELFVS